MSPKAAPKLEKPVDPWAKAIRHLKRVDPQFKAVIQRVGPCGLAPREDRFGALVTAIVSQQISTKAAASINERLHVLAGRPHDPRRLLELDETALRGVGLSGSKARYVLNVATAVADGSVPVDRFDESWDDDRIIEALTSIKGVGVWTAHMFLIFVLNRPDVLPVGDLGVRAGLRDWHGLAELPKPSDCHALAEPWRPYRSVASWYLWRNGDAPS
ncbi:DNA-3-methyladenine glycosylase family protein [Paludisphaera borealis]|uniref:DNA-3-methyladenine glycosylase II n=1 Tax=Paludisphaera borealis TaxID=1387353 RepID=A0A1U7CJ93_9BACT|nr:DNA-3-methyladenine glycosylase [Paludisphaera borealis]APW59002.1 DNA-3-methyladenine glycosylase [Paludisphaera borealis]